MADGDLFDQESKLARSGLASLFDNVEIVSHKDPETYRKLLGRYGVLPEEFAMVGDTLRTDVLPVIEIGGRAYHVPYGAASGPEMVGVGPEHEGAYQTLSRLSDLLQVMDTPEAEPE